nr:hypothetical protein [Salmonella enterica]
MIFTAPGEWGALYFAGGDAATVGYEARNAFASVYHPL